ncbi:MAG: Do family serine endopeptidase [Bacteroidota bacterium]
MKRSFSTILVAVISAVLAVFVYDALQSPEGANLTSRITEDSMSRTLVNRLEGEANRSVYANIPTGLDETATNFTVAAEHSVHAVVHVKTQYTRSAAAVNPLYEFLFGEGYSRQQQPAMGSGSGVIISDDGYIVTNYHVIEKSDQIVVALNDKREFKAEVVGTDPGTDLALLKVEAKELPFMEFGKSDDLKVGEWVLAVGNPFNLTSTVTAGIVSARGRSINIYSDRLAPIESFIQTDAAINRGNSGGALVNLRGELVGINSAISSPTGSYSGYGFAIPAVLVQKVVADIIKFGEVQRAVLGVSIADVTSEIAEDKGLGKIEGVYIAEVLDGGAAERAGIAAGDVILQVEKETVNSAAELQEQIGRYRPGEEVDLTVKRDGKRKQYQVVLRNMQGEAKIVKADEVLKELGAKFQNLSSRELSRLDLPRGVQIVDLYEGMLRRAGIKEGFVITRIGSTEVRQVEDIKSAFIRIAKGQKVEVEGTYPGGRYMYVYQVKVDE